MNVYIPFIILGAISVLFGIGLTITLVTIHLKQKKYHEKTDSFIRYMHMRVRETRCGLNEPSIAWNAFTKITPFFCE